MSYRSISRGDWLGWRSRLVRSYTEGEADRSFRAAFLFRKSDPIIFARLHWLADGASKPQFFGAFHLLESSAVLLQSSATTLLQLKLCFLQLKSFSRLTKFPLIRYISQILC